MSLLCEVDSLMTHVRRAWPLLARDARSSQSLVARREPLFPQSAWTADCWLTFEAAPVRTLDCMAQRETQGVDGQLEPYETHRVVCLLEMSTPRQHQEQQAVAAQ